jgi:hypothetical protein
VRAFPRLDTDRNGVLSRDELGVAGGDIDIGIVQATVITADGARCRPRLLSIEPFEEDAVKVRATFACDWYPSALTVDCAFLQRLSPGHRHIATLEVAGRAGTFVVDPGSERFDVDLRSLQPELPFRTMVWMGIAHIATGYDHIAFLFGLLLLGGRALTLVGLISAFTVAHSITLGLSVLGLVSLPSSIVEPAIALSIAYVGLENIFARDPRARWRITFPFGLVHGLGFAGALTALDLPRARIPHALFGFNLGVELGQLAMLAVILPPVLLARRSPWFRNLGVKTLSAAVAVAGAVWFGLRMAS